MRDTDLATALHDALCRQEHPTGCAWATARWDQEPRSGYREAARLIMRRLKDVPWRQVGAQTGHA